MLKNRKQENVGLPARWKFQHGAYYYRVPPGKEILWDGKQFFRLGDTLSKAYKVWSDKLQATDKANTIGQLLDRYAVEVIPQKAKSSHSFLKNEKA